MEKRVKIPIYCGYLIIISTSKIQEVGDKYGLGNTKEYSAFVFDRLNKKNVNQYFMVFDNKIFTPAIIAHEAFHVTNMIFEDHKISPDLHNDEPQAYLLGWVVEQCHKYLIKT